MPEKPRKGKLTHINERCGCDKKDKDVYWK